MQQLLSQSLTADWFSAMRFNDRFPVFDGNPFDGMQGSGGSQVLAVSTQSDDGNMAVVTATLATFVEGQKGPPHQQKYVLKKENGSWKIDDVFYDPAKEPGRSLHGYLKTVTAREAGTAVASPAAPASRQVAGNPRNADTGTANTASGKYCIEKGATMLLTRPATNGSFEFGFSSWSTRGNYFGIFGVAQPEPGGWRFRQDMNAAKPTERCEAIIARLQDGGYSVAVTPAGPCTSSGGYNAAPPPNYKFLFPARARQSALPAGKPMAEALSLESGGLSCETPQRSR